MKQNSTQNSNTKTQCPTTCFSNRISTKGVSPKQTDDNTFTVTCYGKTERYPESMRQALKHEYMMGMLSCDGNEKERYTNIYLDLECGAKVCSDNC